MTTQLQTEAPGAFHGERIEARNPRSGDIDYRFVAPSRGEGAGVNGRSGVGARRGDRHRADLPPRRGREMGAGRVRGADEHHACGPDVIAFGPSQQPLVMGVEA